MEETPERNPLSNREMLRQQDHEFVNQLQMSGEIEIYETDPLFNLIESRRELKRWLSSWQRRGRQIKPGVLKEVLTPEELDRHLPALTRAIHNLEDDENERCISELSFTLVNLLASYSLSHPDQSLAESLSVIETSAKKIVVLATNRVPLFPHTAVSQIHYPDTNETV